MSEVSEPDFISCVESFGIFCAIKTFTSTPCENCHVLHDPASNLPARGRRSELLLNDKAFVPIVTPIDSVNMYENIKSC